MKQVTVRIYTIVWLLVANTRYAEELRIGQWGVLKKFSKRPILSILVRQNADHSSPKDMTPRRRELTRVVDFYVPFSCTPLIMAFHTGLQTKRRRIRILLDESITSNELGRLPPNGALGIEMCACIGPYSYLRFILYLCPTLQSTYIYRDVAKCSGGLGS